MGHWDKLDEEKPGDGPSMVGWAAIGVALLMGAAMAAGMIAGAIRFVARLF